MTGRYSMKEHKDRRIMKGREPTLGKLFKDNGYTTGIFGKAQPLQTQTKDFQSDIFRSIQFINRRYRLKKLFFTPEILLRFEIRISQLRKSHKFL